MTISKLTDKVEERTCVFFTQFLWQSRRLFKHIKENFVCHICRIPVGLQCYKLNFRRVSLMIEVLYCLCLISELYVSIL